MKNIIVDANILIAIGLNFSEKPTIIQGTKGANLFAPIVLPFEIGNALSAMVKREQIQIDEANECWQTIQSFPVQLLKFDMQQAINLAFANNSYAYDAYYLQLALETGFSLFTFDKKMQNIANSLSIPLIEGK
ncbi:Predicted nucleic acid-binding protein, contains PIN domain [Moraxella lacunata]|uniref:Predicted nucleic acid-binding protein, contains PIN domain n=1 Tax=Moraxella lacunata TaxID=477 RepID=A0A378TUT5_MORLA|nr:type II toxin-antitoxin system VapC family toxin [Moraxella lacunata]STZ63642.1 Predicted nucleic acid-binding protein, contains PIN domain [Moraxella lacunata]